MRATIAFNSVLSLAAAASASPVEPRQGTTSNGTNVVSALWDGLCFYPKSDSTFNLTSYLGRWYQVAGYVAIFDTGCKCITADYTLNSDGTVGVKNECQELDLPITISGTATAADAAYGEVGVFDVSFFNSSAACAGPNYIVQEYVVDDYAIVQSPDFATLFILSREQNVTDSKLDSLISRSVELGSKKSLIVTDLQTGCLYT
ncbi:Outer membrane lipoprotein Blc [Cytospora mali]|nr:Outer membrane lipoprotein Blc [Valsa mali var. pyri (nom. inval.)]